MARRRFLTGPGGASDSVRFAPLEPDCEVIQFDQPLSVSDLRQAAVLSGGRPEVELYVYGRASRDLDFLDYFPDLRRLNIQLYDLEDVSGLGASQGQSARANVWRDPTNVFASLS